MSQIKKPYAVRLNKDPIARKHVAVLRLAGFSAPKIGKILGRHTKTIETEIARPEHKEFVRRCAVAIAKKQLPKEHVPFIEKVISEKDKEE